MKRGLIFFLILSVMIIGLTGGIFVRGTKAESTLENRELKSFPPISLSSFMTTTYQTNLEQALSDQLVFGQSLKRMYNNVKNTNTRLVVSALKYLKGNQEKPQTEKPKEPKPEPIDNFPVTLTPRGNGLMELDDSHHLIFPKHPIEKANILFEKKANNINRLVDNYPSIGFYCFYIETDVDVDFINKKNDHNLANSFQSRLNDQIKFDNLAINSLADYQRRFFKTDHHWNYAGQYEGYQQIVALLKGDSEKLFDAETIMFNDLKFNGYKSRKLDDYTIFDTFGALKVTVPQHKVYVNHKPGYYGGIQAYEKGNYSHKQGYNHYGACNGGDHGLIEFRFNQPEKGNIVIFSESFSNPINRLIAAHYNNTYIIDLRYYQRDCGQRFDFGNFIKDKNISQVLFLGYLYFYANDVFLIND